MHVSADRIARIVSYHSKELSKVKYPSQLNTKSLTAQKDKWICTGLREGLTLCCQQDNPLPVADLQYPLLKYLTVVSGTAAEIHTGAATALNRIGDKILVLIESYNKAALQFLKNVDHTETFFCQRKFLADLQKISSPRAQMPDTLKIRNFAVGQDEENYVRLYNRLLGFLASKIDVTFIQNIISRNSFDPAGYFIAEYSGKAVGFLNLEIEPWGKNGSGFAYIYQIGVDDDWQGSGLAQGLLKRAFDYALSKNCNRIGVGVRKSNAPAVTFFMKQGFKEAYRVTGYLLENIC